MQAFKDKNYEIIAKNLRKFRKNLGVSQEEFAEMVSVERETISRTETADKANRPGLILLMEIAFTLKVPLAELFKE